MKKITTTLFVIIQMVILAQPNQIVTKITMLSDTFNLSPYDTAIAIVDIDTTKITGSYMLQIKVGFQGDYTYSTLITPYKLHYPGTYAKYKVSIINNGTNFGAFYGQQYSINANYNFQITISKTGWNGSSPAIQNIQSPLFRVNQIPNSTGINQVEIIRQIKQTTYYNELGQSITTPSGFCIQELIYADGRITRRKVYIIIAPF